MMLSGAHGAPEHGRALDFEYHGMVAVDAASAPLELVKLGRSGGKGRAQAPTVPYDEIRITIDLRQSRAAHAA